MPRHTRWLTPVCVLALLAGACNRDEVVGLDGISASRAAVPLQDVILFTTDAFGPRLQLAVMRPDGSGRQQLTNDDHFYLYPAISPDGRRIAVAKFKSDDTPEGIFLLNADGSEQSLLVNRSSEFGSPFFSDFTLAWSPDGRQIAFASWVLEGGFGPFARIFVINVDGTGLRQVTPSVGPGEFAFDEGPSWSPDGTRIVFTRTLVLHVINADGTGLTALPNEDFAVSAAWSPDGQRIAYAAVDGSDAIRIRNADGSNPVTVAVGAWPRWSPDGRRLVFNRFIANRGQVLVSNVDGTGETRLSFGTHDQQPTWSPFPPARSGAGASIEIAPTDASLTPTETRQFTATVRNTNGDVISLAPVAWSSTDPAVATVTQSGLVTAVASGTAEIHATFAGQSARAQVTVVDNVLVDAIAFFTRQFSTVNGGLAVMGEDGSNRRPLPGGELGFEPSISPDGRRIAFSRNTDIGVTSIYVMNVDGTGTRSVADGIVLNPGPVWSPDGCQIAFRNSLETSGGSVGRISIVNADGTGLRQVSPEPGPNEFAFDESPTWSPSGTQLAFTRNAFLHVINVDGTGLTALPNEDMASNPSWSPDGERIAYSSGGEIRLRSADGSNLTIVTTGAFDFWPRWAPDSRRLVIAHVEGDGIQTVTINADGTNPVNLTPAGVLDFMPDWGRPASSATCGGS